MIDQLHKAALNLYLFCSFQQYEEAKGTFYYE